MLVRLYLWLTETRDYLDDDEPFDPFAPWWLTGPPDGCRWPPQRCVNRR